MLDYFFSNKHPNRGDLFEGLSIWEDEKYRQLQGTYPVISLTFANVKETSFENTKKRIYQILIDLYVKNSFLIKEHMLEEEEADYPEYELAITNHELRHMFLIMVSGWFKQSRVD